jgi:hypothetical protein
VLARRSALVPTLRVVRTALVLARQARAQQRAVLALESYQQTARTRGPPTLR